MWSGVYPHSNKVEGFYQVANPEYLTLSDLMQQVGYFTAIRHKSQDSTPYSPYPWDLVLDTSPTGDLLERKTLSLLVPPPLGLLRPQNLRANPFRC